ncbi:MAG: 30S ribosomal protein S21 [Thermodesulfobacteriota bacterium]
MEVKVFGDFEKALRIFKMKVTKDGILGQVKRRHDGFDSSSVKRRNKHHKHLLRLKKMERKMR